MLSKDNLHCNHRARMRERLFSAGAENLQDHELLEMFLFAVESRKNTNEMAHALIERFGSLRGVFCANPEALREIPGIKDAASAHIFIFRELMRRIDSENRDIPTTFENRTQMCEFILELYKYSAVEELYMLMFDGNDRFIGQVLISRGNDNTVSMDIRKMVKEALGRGAASIVIAHNHPNGKLMASMEDVTLTRDASLALNKIGIEVVDHILVANNKYTSIMNSTF